MEKKRPIPITIICIFLFVTFSFGIFMFLMPAGLRMILSAYGKFVTAISLINLLLGFAAIYGLWNMKTWGFFCYCAMLVINILSSIIFKAQSGIAYYLISFIIVGILAYYFKLRIKNYKLWNKQK